MTLCSSVVRHVAVSTFVLNNWNETHRTERFVSTHVLYNWTRGLSNDVMFQRRSSGCCEHTCLEQLERSASHRTFREHTCLVKLERGLSNDVMFQRRSSGCCEHTFQLSKTSVRQVAVITLVLNNWNEAHRTERFVSIHVLYNWKEDCAMTSCSSVVRQVAVSTLVLDNWKEAHRTERFVSTHAMYIWKED